MGTFHYLLLFNLQIVYFPTVKVFEDDKYIPEAWFCSDCLTELNQTQGITCLKLKQY